MLRRLRDGEVKLLMSDHATPDSLAIQASEDLKAAVSSGWPGPSPHVLEFRLTTHVAFLHLAGLSRYPFWV